MNTFPGYDHILCDREECARKKTCKRYLTWRKAIEDKSSPPYAVAVFSSSEDVENCSMYEDVETHRFKRRNGTRKKRADNPAN